jgi:cell shape-determining protein MreD
METFIAILIVLGVLAYLGLGIVIARALAKNSDGTMRWWQRLLIVLLWPFIPFLFLLAFLGWVNDGSH